MPGKKIRAVVSNTASPSLILGTVQFTSILHPHTEFRKTNQHYKQRGNLFGASKAEGGGVWCSGSDVVENLSSGILRCISW